MSSESNLKNNHQKSSIPANIPVFKETCDFGQLVYHPFRFYGYTSSRNGKDISIHPECESGREPTFPTDNSITGSELLISLCNLAKTLDSFENRIPIEQLIKEWCVENMHPYNIEFIYSELKENFDINSVDADFVRRDGTFELSEFMKDLERLYNAVRFYVSLENFLQGKDITIYKQGRYFDSPPHYVKDLCHISKISEMINNKTLNQPFDCTDQINDFNDIRRTLTDLIPEFSIKLKLNTTSDKFEFSVDINSVFDIAWYTLGHMISKSRSINNCKADTSPEGILLCCQSCGKFMIRRSNRQEFCNAKNCQKIRNARKQKAYRNRKAGK